MPTDSNWYGRRQILRAVGTGGLTLGAGCMDRLTDTDEDREPPTSTPNVPQSSDVDSEVYGDDLDEAARHRRVAVESSPPTPRDALQWYSYAELGVQLDREMLRRIRPSLTDSELRVTAVALSYPEGEVHGAGLSDATTAQGETAVTVGLDFPHGAVGETVVFYVSVVDAAVNRNDVVEESLAGLLAASDPVSVTENGLERHRPGYEPSDRVYDGVYTRRNVEGGYTIEFDPTIRDLSVSTTVPVYVPKAIYAAQQTDQSARAHLPIDERVALVRDARKGRLPTVLAETFKQTALLNGYTDPSEQLLLAVRFIQSLPYVLDEQSVGFGDYTRMPSETLVDLEGDCIDTSVLLAAVLDAKGYETALLFELPPNPSEAGHAAVGVNLQETTPPGADAPFSHRDTNYHYIETTNTWDIGHIPRQVTRRDVTVKPI